MSYTDPLSRVRANRAWESRFTHDALRDYNNKSLLIKSLPKGKVRRDKLLALLKTGFRICLDASQGGSWLSKDKDVVYLLKKNKVRRVKQYEHSAVSEHKSHYYLCETSKP